MSAKKEKIFYFITFIIMFKTMILELYIFFLYLLFSIFEDILRLFGGEKPSHDIFLVIPPELFLIFFVLTVLSVFILGFIDKWRWIGALIIVVATISTCVLSFYAFDISFTDIGGLYVILSFITVLFPIKILFDKFKPVKEEVVGVLQN